MNKIEKDLSPDTSVDNMVENGIQYAIDIMHKGPQAYMSYEQQNSGYSGSAHISNQIAEDEEAKILGHGESSSRMLNFRNNTKLPHPEIRKKSVFKDDEEGKFVAQTIIGNTKKILLDE